MTNADLVVVPAGKEYFSSKTHGGLKMNPQPYFYRALTSFCAKA